MAIRPDGVIEWGSREWGVDGDDDGDDEIVLLLLMPTPLSVYE